MNKSNGSSPFYYYCHRNKTYKSRSTGKRRIKPYIKMGINCPSRIKGIILQNGQISVNCISTHVDHDFSSPSILSD